MGGQLIQLTTQQAGSKRGKGIDVLLINPPMCSDKRGKPTTPERIGITCGFMPPTQLLTLATVLEQHEVRARVLDLAALAAANDVEQLLADVLNEVKVPYVGLSDHSVINLDTIETLAAIAKSNGAEVLVGGMNATHMQGEIFSYVPSADVVFAGFAEKTFLDYIRDGTISRGVITKGRATVPSSMHAVLGNASDVTASLALMNAVGKFDLGLLMYVEKYVKAGCIYPIETQRGCEKNCNICTSKMLSGGKPLRREVEHVIQQMKEAIEAGFTEFFFTDNIVTGDREFIIELCKRMAAEGIKKKTKNILAMTSVDKVDAEVLDLMGRAGFTGLGFGVETAGDVQKLGKGIEKDENLIRTGKVLKLARAAGIETTAFLIVGAPYDTAETLQATLEYCEEAIREGWMSYATISMFRQLPGTDYYLHPEKHDVEPLKPEDFRNAWYFNGRATTRTPKLTRAELEDWYRIFKQKLQTETPIFEEIG